MANITETAQWEAAIREIATTDPVVGGPTGPANIQAQQLANRTAYLKAQITNLLAGGGGGGGGTVPNATELAAGIMAIATQAETNAGTIDNKAVTPLKLANATSTSIATHEQAADPHPQYLTQPEADALYPQIGSALTISSFPASLTQNGYQQLPSGLIIQWFTASHTPNVAGWTQFPIVFPIAFNNSVFGVLSSVSSASTPASPPNPVPVSGGIEGETVVYGITNTGATVTVFESNLFNTDFIFLAIGH